MSSELERLLREAGQRLPQPEAGVSARARGLALRAVRRRRLRRPAALVLAAALVGAGIAIGALLVPSGTAAPAITGLGFLPAQGWSVLQNGGDGTPVRPAVAIAANVVLSPDDDPDGLPLSTLETLPPSGVVIVASFVARGHREYYDRYFPSRTLPLRVADTTRGIEYGVDVRPERPLGQYQLRAGVSGHNVDVNIYYGTDPPPPALLAAAQRQLDHMIVRSSGAPAPVTRRQQALPAAVPRPPTLAVDRTLSCAAGDDNGVRWITVSAQSGFLRGDRFEWLGQLTVTTPGSPLSKSRGYLPTLAGVTAGWPPPALVSSGGVGYDASHCTLTPIRVPLARQNLPGGGAGPSGQEARCLVGSHVLVHVRAAFVEPIRPELDTKRSWFGANARISRGQIAVTTAGGQPLAYGEVTDAGRARLYLGRRCT